MKTTKKNLIILAVAALSLVACQKQETRVPEIAPDQDEILVSYPGGTYEITYNLTNPVEGGRILADCNEEATWIHNITTLTGKVSFEADENTSDTERTATITITYEYPEGEISCEVSIRQGAAGQQPSPGGEDPYIENLTGNIEAPSDGGDYEINYTIHNPEDNGNISTSCNAQWITGLTDSDGKITFTVLPNEGGVRETKITIEYIWLEGKTSIEVNVKQDELEVNPDEEVFELEVSDITYSSAFCKVTPKNEDMRHLAMVVDQSLVAGFSDEEWFEDDMMVFQQTADMFGISLQQYLDTYRIHSGYLEFTVTGLDPDTDFYLYAYGIDNSGSYPELITRICKKPFTTEKLEVVEGEIVLDVEIYEQDATIVATPWDDNMLYYVDWMSESLLNQKGYTSGTIEERLVDYTYDWMLSYLSFWPIESLGYYGPKSVSFKITKPDDTYYAFAYVLNEDATAGSEVFLKTITNGSEISSASVRKASNDYLMKKNIDERPVRPE